MEVVLQHEAVSSMGVKLAEKDIQLLQLMNALKDITSKDPNRRGRGLVGKCSTVSDFIPTDFIPSKFTFIRLISTVLTLKKYVLCLLFIEFVEVSVMTSECKKQAGREKKWDFFLENTPQGKAIRECILKANVTWTENGKNPRIGSRISSLFQEDSDHHHSACYTIGATKTFRLPTEGAPQVLNMLRCIANGVGLEVYDEPDE